MHFFERKFSLGLLMMTLPLLFLPKFNLISLQNETAGMRLDDAVLFFIGALLMYAHSLLHHRLYKVEGWMLLLTGFSILSYLINRLLVSSDILHTDAKILYTIRLLEYFLFFYVGAMASRYFKVSTLVKAFFLWNVFWMILQKLSLAGAITSEGYNLGASTRVYGIASFPSEMGLLLNLLFCYMIYDPTPRCRLSHLFSSPIRYFLQKFYLYWMFGLFGIFIIFTGNRISIVALFICFFYRLKSEFNWRSFGSLLPLALISPFLIAGITLLIMNTASLYERSAGLLSFKNLELATIVWDKVDITKETVDQDMAQPNEYDMSWWIRIHKWIHILKSYVTTPASYLQGLGPGFAGAALDGGLLRILTEYGLIGVFLFGKLFSSLYRINLQTKWMVIAFLINMIFFDAYLAYKTMSFLFFTCGDAFERQHRSAQINHATSACIPN